MKNGKLGDNKTPKLLNRLSQNLAPVIMSATYPACQNSNRSPQWGRPGKWVCF